MIPIIETKSAKEILDFQFSKITELISYAQAHSPFYKRLIGHTKIKSWADFQQLPTTSKDDLQSNNWDFLCVDRKKIIEYTSTSGTLGKPVTIGLTDTDLQRLAYNEYISFTCADGQRSDLYQLMLTLDRQFMAGIAYYEGIRKLGAGLIRVGPGLPAMQWETIERLKPTVLVAVPSFIVKLIDFAQAKGIALNNSSVKKIVCIGEGLRTADFQLNTLSRRIVEAWDVKLYGTYASTEMQTAFTECSHAIGGHSHPELIFVELLDDDGNPVKSGDAGEVTISTLGVHGMPLIRYRTGDICHAHVEPCGCGRNTLRLGPVVGRKQQMIKFKGTTLYPPAVFEILHQNVFVRDYVVEAFTGNLGTDELKIYVSISDHEQSEAEKSLSGSFQSRLRVLPDFKFISQKEVEQLQQDGGRKIRKFIDNREKQFS